MTKRLRPLALLVAALSLLLSLSAQHALAFRCGVQRWPVKTGTDSDIGSVDLSQATPTTIHDLINLAEPADRPQDARVPPVETTVWTLDATLKEWKWENSPTSGDWDYHLVLEDADGHSMVGEIPFPDCVDAASPLKPRITIARQVFDSAGIPAHQPVGIPVRITGIAFFDLHSAGHNPTGSAANGIEIHPILDLILNPTTPQPTPVPPTPSPVPPTPSPTTVPPTPAPAPPMIGQIVVNGGFETAKHSGLSTDGWAAHRHAGPQHNVIIFHGIYPNSGANYAQLGGYNRIDETLAQTISIPPGHASLIFMANVVTREAEDADPYDTLAVEVRDSQNQVLATVVTLSNQDFSKSHDDPGSYFEVTADLSAFAGQTVMLVFHAKTDNASTTTFRVDDVTLAATP